MLRNATADWLTAQWNEELAQTPKIPKKDWLKLIFGHWTEALVCSLIKRKRERDCILSLPTWFIFTPSLWVKATPFSLPPTHSPPLSLHPSIRTPLTHFHKLWRQTGKGGSNLSPTQHFLWPPPPIHIFSSHFSFILQSLMTTSDGDVCLC